MAGSADAAELSAPASPKTWNFACPDWKTRLRDRRSLLPALPLDEKRAARAVALFNNLRLPDVPGQPLLGEAGGEWTRDIVRAVFGSLDEHGARHVAEVFALVPKKNNKTTGGAAIMLTALLENERPYGEFLFVGPTQEVADRAFSQAAGMIAADREGFLQKRFAVRAHLKTIVDRLNQATLRVTTFDPKVATGGKPVGILVDELHVMSGLSYATRVVGQLRGGLLPNPEGFLIFITTQPDLAPAGVFKAELAYARGVRDGTIVDHVRMLPILYEFPEEMQIAKERPWLDPENWPMVLPNLGLSISLDRLVADFEGAKTKGEEEIRRWASQHLNVQIGLALHSQRWRGADYWEAAGVERLDLETLLARAEVAVVGVDAGGLDDLFAIAVAGRCRATRNWLYWVRAWADPSVLELRKDIAEALKDFEAAGDLTFAPTTEETIADVVALVERVAAAKLFPKEAGIGCDPAGIGALIDALSDAGFEEPLVVGVAPQGYKLSSAIWSMERKLKDKTIEHGAQPLMAFAVGNAAAEQRGNSVHITKQVAGKAKIDPLIAAFIATKLLEANPVAHRGRPSVTALRKPHDRTSRVFAVHR